MEKTLIKKPVPVIDKEYMELTIREMWDAINDIKCDDERDMAIADGNRIEQNLRQKFEQQELLREAAPELIDVIFDLVKWHKLTYGDGVLKDSALARANNQLRLHDMFPIRIVFRKNSGPGLYFLIDLKEPAIGRFTKNHDRSIIFKSREIASKYFKEGETITAALPGDEGECELVVSYNETFDTPNDSWYNK